MTNCSMRSGAIAGRVRDQMASADASALLTTTMAATGTNHRDRGATATLVVVASTAWSSAAMSEKTKRATCEAFRVLRNLGQQHLDRDVALEARIARAIDRTL